MMNGTASIKKRNQGICVCKEEVLVNIHELDGYQLAEMVIQSADHLSQNAKMVDALNVFPVPDGDTGTNMNLSMSSGAKEVKSHQSKHVGEVSKAFAKGLLMGARGNSGVILSQLFRGFSKAMEQQQTINSKEFARAFSQGVETAYKAVMKPVEGTILTVAKDAAKRAVEVAENERNIVVVMEALLEEAKKSLMRTPDLLPVLKEVGVVDSGGQGLVTVYEGFLSVLKGESLPKVSIVEPSMKELVQAEHHKSMQGYLKTEDIEFGYCTEFMVKFDKENQADAPFNEDEFREKLSEHGDSLLVVSNEDLVKIHIHAEYPGDVMTYAQTFGNLINIKIENMREQHMNIISEQGRAHENETKVKQKQAFGIVTVGMGKGIHQLFKSMGAQVVIDGGQTMNPSTENIIEAVREVNAETVYILPNNGNIIMAAKQAADVADDNNVVVIPTKTVPQGMSALLSFDPNSSSSENEERMNKSIGQVKTGQVTYAVRTTKIDDVEINKGEYMGILDGKIVVTDRDKNAAAKKLLEKMVSENDEIVTIIQGEEADDDDISVISDYLEDQFADVEVEVHQGLQPLYPYIFAVE
jgi:DAK2 domain fusion protein YloV